MVMQRCQHEAAREAQTDEDGAGGVVQVAITQCTLRAGQSSSASTLAVTTGVTKQLQISQAPRRVAHGFRKSTAAGAGNCL